VVNAIRFLETVGSDARLSGASAGVLAAALDSFDMGAEERRALLDADIPALTGLLKGREKMFCMIIAPDGAEEKESPDEPVDQPEEESPKE